MIHDLDRLLPHRPPMRLIDEVVAVSGTQAEALAMIRDDHLFMVSGRGVPAWTGIEMLAQCTALIGGFQALTAGGRQVPGYLLGCRGYRARRSWFLPGQTLHLAGQELMRDGSLAVYEGRIVIDGQEVASGRLNIHTGLARISHKADRG